MLSIDLGASTVDIIKWLSQDEYKLVASLEYEGSFVIDDLKEFLEARGIDFVGQEIAVTGGRSAHFDKSEFKIVGEIEAIAKGGSFLVKKRDLDNFIVVSMGTGTCLVHVEGNDFEHIGGTGIGGGTFLALSKELFKVQNLEEVKSLYKRGNKNKVDLSVEEVIGSGIGIVPADITASNLGKIARDVDFSKEDLAAGVVNMIGQTIATASCFAAKSVSAKNLVLTGKLARIEAIVEVIKKAAKVYGIDVILPKDACYVSAIGAGICYSNP